MRTYIASSMKGTIPAYAGEPGGVQADFFEVEDDPRVRGGTGSDIQLALLCMGRSPRTRGNLLLKPQPRRPLRTIPAYAGEPWCDRVAKSDGWDDPRVRGGTPSPTHDQNTTGGRSPRTRGTCSTSRASRPPMGRSPRTRGNRDGHSRDRPARGTIPAYAGEPSPAKSALQAQWDDPRVRGGTKRRRAMSDGD